jgi:hypothetical protein
VRPRRITLSTVVKATASLVGFVSALLGLVFLLRPGLQPDEPPPPPPPPARTRASLSPITVEPRISRRQYLSRTDQSAIGFTEEQLAVRGAFVRIRVQINGFRAIPITFSRELVDAATGEQLSQTDAFTITPPADEVDRDFHDWVPLEDRSGRYFLIFKLLAPEEDAPLATLQTKELAGLGD